jgi:colanic acid/amylovoran biosynthesis glycosyltransferase
MADQATIGWAEDSNDVAGSSRSGVRRSVTNVAFSPASTVRVAYLINQYPKGSHTFIRRELAALERQGLDIQRVSIRRTTEELVDPADKLEADRTRVILDLGMPGLMRAIARRAARSPRRLLNALQLALSISKRSDRGKLRHIAYLGEACVLLDWLKESDCNHVHAHFGTNSAAVAMLARELGGPPFSFTVHGPEEFDNPRMIGMQEKIERAQFVIAISEYGRSQLFRNCNASHWSKIHLVHCGLDREFLEAPTTAVPDRPRLVSVGRLEEQKGQMLLVQAAAQLMAEGRNFELVLVGDGLLRPQIEAEIARVGLGDRVRITGWASGERVREEIRAARALVQPSFAEGLPMVIMEALALRRPVVSTYVAGIPELVDRDCGWLVPAGSVEPLVTAMKRVLDAPAAQLDRMGAAGQVRVRERHHIDTEVAKLHFVFDRSVEQTGFVTTEAPLLPVAANAGRRPESTAS